MPAQTCANACPGDGGWGRTVRIEGKDGGYIDAAWEWKPLPAEMVDTPDW